MKTIVYVDAFNLYYGCLKGTPYRWLNLQRLSELLVPQHEVIGIKYFTARVTARPHDPDQPIRQQTYFRALKTLSGLSIIEGHFLTSRVRMPLADPKNGRNTEEVIKTEEKGSDVNLASHLLIDGFRRSYEAAVVITNDSDLLMPIKFVKTELQIQIGILNPYKRSSRVLLPPNVSFMKPIREGVLRSSQFPDTLTDSNGTFTKPSSW